MILTGTTTPNCVRTTCYDAIALEYNAVVLTDCCSSHTEEIQRVNLEGHGPGRRRPHGHGGLCRLRPRHGGGSVRRIRRKMLEEDAVPEPFGTESGRSFWPDLW